MFAGGEILLLQGISMESGARDNSSGSSDRRMRRTSFVSPGKYDASSLFTPQLGKTEGNSEEAPYFFAYDRPDVHGELIGAPFGQLNQK